MPGMKTLLHELSYRALYTKTAVALIAVVCMLGTTQAGAASPTPSGARPSPTQLYAIRLNLLQNPNKVPELVRARPAYQGGTLIGYRIEPGPKPRLFYRLGLHPGDVVTRINGTPVTPRNRLWLISQVSLSNRVNVTLLRHGHRRTFDYRFRHPSR